VSDGVRDPTEKGIIWGSSLQPKQGTIAIAAFSSRIQTNRDSAIRQIILVFVVSPTHVRFFYNVMHYINLRFTYFLLTRTNNDEMIKTCQIKIPVEVVITSNLIVATDEVDDVTGRVCQHSDSTAFYEGRQRVVNVYLSLRHGEDDMHFLLSHFLRQLTHRRIVLPQYRFTFGLHC